MTINLLDASSTTLNYTRCHEGGHKHQRLRRSPHNNDHRTWTCALAALALHSAEGASVWLWVTTWQHGMSLRKWLFQLLVSFSKQPCHHNLTTGRQICFDMSAKELPGSGTWAGNNTDTACQALHDIIKVFERVRTLDCQRNPYKKKVFLTIEFWGIHRT